MTNEINLEEFEVSHPLRRAFRSVSQNWFLCYSKLMGMKWEWSSTVPFGATDGQTLWLNREGVDRLAEMPKGAGLIAFLLVHEALHGLLGHGWRVAPLTDRETANEAADYIVNAMIDHRNKELGREVFPFISGVLLNHSLSGDKAVEQLYRELRRPKPQSQPQPQPQPQPKPQQKKDDSDDTQDKQPNGRGANKPKNESPEANEDGDDSGSGDSPADSCDDGRPVDSGSSGSRAGKSDEEILRDFVGTGSPDNFEPQESESQTKDELIRQLEQENERVLIADRIESRQRSESGLTGRRVADQRATTKRLDWAEILRDWMYGHRLTGAGSPLNRTVYTTTGLVCAGPRTRAAGEYVLIIDTSGSISTAMMSKFLRQAQTILDEVQPERLVILSVSHKVMDSVQLEVGDIVPSELAGGGGTKFQPAFDWIDDNMILPDLVVYLTDGLASDIDSLKDPGYPVLWMSTQSKQKDYPFGTVVEVFDI